MMQPLLSHPQGAFIPKKLGQLLLEHQIISSEQLIEALRDQTRHNAHSQNKLKLGQILVRGRLLHPDILKVFLRMQGLRHNR